LRPGEVGEGGQELMLVCTEEHCAERTEASCAVWQLWGVIDDGRVRKAVTVDTRINRDVPAVRIHK